MVHAFLGQLPPALVVFDDETRSHQERFRDLADCADWQAPTSTPGRSAELHHWSRFRDTVARSAPTQAGRSVPRQQARCRCSMVMRVVRPRLSHNAGQIEEDEVPIAAFPSHAWRSPGRPRHRRSIARLCCDAATLRSDRLPHRTESEAGASFGPGTVGADHIHRSC